MNAFLAPPDWRRSASLCGIALLLAACSTLREPLPETPLPQTPSPESANASAPPPAAQAKPPAAVLKSAVPRVEPIARGAPNVPYEVNGRSYAPGNDDTPLFQRGIASWYGRPFHGRQTANGEVYDMNAMTAAHKTMPLPSYARVRNTANGREIVVRVNDRGPFKPGRVIDLSRAAAKLLQIDGLGAVEVTRLTHEDIRSGAWQREGDGNGDAARAVADAR